MPPPLVGKWVGNWHKTAIKQLQEGLKMKVKTKQKPTQPEPEPALQGETGTEPFMDDSLDDLLGDSSGVITNEHLEQIAPRIDHESSSGKPAFGGFAPPSIQEPIEPAKLLDRAVTKWPVVPHRRMTWDTFQAWYRTLTPYHHQHFIASLYRKKPVINRPKGERYIDKFGGSLENGPDPNLTIQYIVNQHGGGSYNLIINNSSLARSKKTEDIEAGNANEVCEVHFDIEWDVAMPKLNLMELQTSHPNNKSYVEYLVREGKLDANTHKPIQPATPATETAAVVREFSDLMKNVIIPATQNNKGNDGYLSHLTTLQGKMFDLVKDQKGAKSDLETLAALLPMIEKMIGNNKPDTSSTDVYLKSLVEQNTLLMKMVMDKATAPPPPPPPPPPDPFEQFNKMLEFQNKMRESVQPTVISNDGDDDEEGGSKKRRNKWDVVFDHLPQLLGPLATVATALLARSLGGGPVQPQPQQQQINPATALLPATTNPSNPTPVNPTQPNPQQPNPQPIGANVMTDPNSGLPLSPVETKVLELLPPYGQMIINAIYDGKHGGEFAQMLVTFTGGPQNGYAAIASLGDKRILELFKSVPPFWANLANREPAVIRFIHEFTNYPESLEWDDDGNTVNLEDGEEGLVNGKVN